jgi:uncharacterized membrane protein YphA (DoxX/SURF4 family)
MLLVGRTLLGLLFLVSGIRGAMFYPGIIDYFTKLGFAVPQTMVWLAVLIEVGGGAARVDRRRRGSSTTP